MTNNIGYVLRRSNAEMTKLTRLGTLIPEQDKLDLLDIEYEQTAG